MADQDHDQEVSRRYRELGRDEPPSKLDAAIRAAARRAARARPAPLVAPTGRRRWYFPVAAAAVIVLAVAVTSQVEREQAAPEPEVQKERKFSEERPQMPEPQKKKTESPAKGADKPAAAAEAPRPVAPAESATGAISQSRQDAFEQRETRARQERPSSGMAAAPAPQRQMQRDGAEPQARAKLSAETPEQWLERIAQLRQQGKHDEADKALAEFRKRYPDYRIPEAMRKKVERK